ncbi:hypothetical protein EWE75_24105 [Sphingomonas populi]|uniref:Uncharacterized protein n=1 Tax=Sphingomonas populi TaxID=2484750 RepID=A0A4Q6XNT9_9SPHN|nr:hypothetical protein [Sphingomonas populi]RZF59022.1 hypothetical protein EWE75_24105 [Sphingomonas populi]
MEVPTPSLPPLDGTQTIAELAKISPITLAAMGKQSIKDMSNRRRQIEGLKPGSSSIRTVEMIEEIVDRLRGGETLTSILKDTHLPRVTTLWNWREADEALDQRIKRAQAQGQHTLADERLDIALGCSISTGDTYRDSLVIKTINANIAQRNRAEFGERVQVDHASVVINLPPESDGL